MEKPYTNREFDAKFKILTDALVEFKTDLLGPEGGILPRIEAQTTKTNGRVTSLEGAENKRNGARTVLLVVGIPLITILMGWLSWMSITIINMSAKLETQQAVINAQSPITTD